MKRWLIIIAVLLVLGAAGFCIYWFVFRDTSDGPVSNKETLYAIQNVLEDQGYDLDSIFEEHKQVEFTTDKTKAMFGVFADSAKNIGDSELFSLYRMDKSAQSTFSKDKFVTYFEKPLVFAYAALYENEFNKNQFKQNVLYSQNIKISAESDATETYKLKVQTTKGKDIIITYVDFNGVVTQVTLNYSFRTDQTTYSLTAKSAKLVGFANEINQYEYTFASLVKEDGKITNSEFVSAISTEKYNGKTESYSLVKMSAELYAVKLSLGEYKNYKYTTTYEKSDTGEYQIFEFMIEDLKDNFALTDELSSAKTTKTDNLYYAYKYFHK